MEAGTSISGGSTLHPGAVMAARHRSRWWSRPRPRRGSAKRRGGVLGSRVMNEQTMVAGGGTRRVIVGAALALSLVAGVACGGAVQSGVAVGKVGHGLSGYAHAVPQAAEVCALSEALAALPGSEK